MDRGPTAYAVGCILAPLRGFCLRAAFLRRSAACACGLHSCVALRLLPAGCLLASLCGFCLRAAFLAPLCGLCLQAAFLRGFAAVAYEWLAACVRFSYFLFLQS